MKCNYCSAEFDCQLNVCPICGKPTENYRGGMRTNTGVISDRPDYAPQKESKAKVIEPEKTQKIENIKSIVENDIEHNEKENLITDNTDEEKNNSATVNGVEFDDVFVDDEIQSEKKKSLTGIIVVLVIILIGMIVFGLYKTGVFDKLFKSVDSPVEITTEDDITVESQSVVEPVTEEMTEKETQCKQGNYKVVRENGAQMYSVNNTSDSTPTHIVAKGETVEIKSFYVDGNTYLGFAVIGDYNGWIDMSYVEFVSEDSENTTKESIETTKAKSVSTTEVKTTEKTENTTNKSSTSSTQGKYKVSDKVNNTTNGTLNVRSEKDYTVDNIVAVLNPGDIVTVVEWDGNWAEISYQGSVLGYVYGDYLEENQ